MKRKEAKAKRIRNYNVVKKLMKEYFDKELESARRHLERLELVYGRPEFVSESGKFYTDGELIVYPEDVSRAKEHLEKFLPKYKKQWEDRLEAADNAGKLVEINISVNWSRNHTWGMNPHAEAWVCFEDPEYGTRSAYGEDRASGCGYDKRSAAMNGALCLACKKKDDEERKTSCRLGRASIDRFVIEHGEELWKEYAIDRTPFPHLSFGGKGTGTFTGLFRQIGNQYQRCMPVTDYLIDYRERDYGSDVYHIIRKDRI